MDSSNAKSDTWRGPLHSSGSAPSQQPARPGDPSSGRNDVWRGPLHSSGSVPSQQPARSNDPSSGRNDAWRGPLHTSGSVAAQPARSDNSSGRNDAWRGPLQTSGSVPVAAARNDGSSIRSGAWRRALQNSGSVAVAPTRVSEFVPGAPRRWPGPQFVPESVAELELPPGFVEDLALKVLYLRGPLSLREFAEQIRLTFGVVNEVLRRMRAEQLCEVKGMIGNMPQVAITTQGRERATELLALNQYAGAAPVSLAHYAQQVREQSVRNIDVHAPAVERAFAHLVLEPNTLEKLGTALNSGTSIFLYGPSGTGKSTIAMALAQVLTVDQVWVPHAVEVDGQIITVYDPHLHNKISDSYCGDPRWVLCQRPTVLVGGELTIEMLELQFNPVMKYYTAPVQMKANNGFLIIDDFGRQRLRPEELLNRWVVPLDRKIDYLTMSGGRKVEVPFEPCVVFATNLEPSTLADEAFLRRIQTKIYLGPVNEQQFHAIFRAVCSTCGLQCESEVINELITIIRKELKEPLRACHPRDLVNQICWKARYKQTEPCLDRDALLAAVDSYFVRGDAESPAEKPPSAEGASA
jgi:MoxR-like ATPase